MRKILTSCSSLINWWHKTAFAFKSVCHVAFNCLTELWSCSTAVPCKEQNSMKTALFHLKKKKKRKKWILIFFTDVINVVLFLKLCSVAKNSYFHHLIFFKVFWKYAVISNFSTDGEWGNECCILSFARFLKSWASDWAVRFKLPPPSLQTAAFSSPLDSSFVILHEWCVSA